MNAPEPHKRALEEKLAIKVRREAREREEPDIRDRERRSAPRDPELFNADDFLVSAGVFRDQYAERLSAAAPP